MPQTKGNVTQTRVSGKASRKAARTKGESRHTVALSASVAGEVQRYAQSIDVSMSKAIGALVRLGLENQENRKKEFFKKLKENLAADEPEKHDQLVDEFRTLILGR